MGTITLYHGTPDKIVTPTYGLGEDRHDYGRGFYLTENVNLAREWAVCRPDEVNGWVHKYELDCSELKILDFEELWTYFNSTEHYSLKKGKALEGFMSDWIGEFYAYYQWYYNIASVELVEKIPVSFLKKAYYGLHDLELDLAVKKVRRV